MNYHLTPLLREEQMHSRRVSVVSAFLAETSSLSSLETDVVMQSALLHDIGKTALPKEVRGTVGRISQTGQPLLLTHTTIGNRMLKGTEPVLSTAAAVALQHHEYLDGSGCFGLYDGDIHPHAKLVTVANTFDFLSFQRMVWDLEQVRAELVRRSKTQLDKNIVALLLDNLWRINGICRYVNTHSRHNTHT